MEEFGDAGRYGEVDEALDRKPRLTFLRAIDAIWFDDLGMPELLKRPIESFETSEIFTVVRELDRRFMQLWHKVQFERNSHIL